MAPVPVTSARSSAPLSSNVAAPSGKRRGIRDAGGTVSDANRLRRRGRRTGPAIRRHPRRPLPDQHRRGRCSSRTYHAPAELATPGEISGPTVLQKSSTTWQQRHRRAQPRGGFSFSWRKHAGSTSQKISIALCVSRPSYVSATKDKFFAYRANS